MGAFTFGSFVYEQYSTIPPVTKADLTGKTIAIIGANAGLGFEAAKNIARMSPGKLILGSRDSEKSRKALKEIKGASGFENVELWTIDLASFDSVKTFADRFDREGERLDILLENASTTPVSSWQTDDGWESTLKVNCIAPALLAILLLPLMVKTGKKFGTIPRITIVTSEMHMTTNLDQKLIHSGHFWKTFGSKEYCTKEILEQRYPDTKLLELFFARSLTDHLGHTPTAPIVNTVNPGFCYSELLRGMWKKAPAAYIRLSLMQLLLARKTEVGSRTLVHAATSGVGNEDQQRGAYLSACQISEAGDMVVSLDGKRARDALWAELVPILEEIDPRVTMIVAEHLSSKK